jgi:branched-chain amino acid aminotransferase
MAAQIQSVGAASRNPAADMLEHIAATARVFVCMPCVKGITPRILLEKGTKEDSVFTGQQDRYYGTFRLDEIGVPAFDHGLLYGDGVFEGILIANDRLFQWREHLDRLWSSAERLRIQIPYSPEQLTQRILGAVNSTRVEKDDRGSYLRLVVTRGIGDLGINPAGCVGSTVYCVISKIQLYPESTYERGIKLSLANRVRRAGADALSPQIKSCNYLNDIEALLDTAEQGTQETLMITRQNFVAEATTENVFVLTRRSGWENDPSRIVLNTPSTAYCLKGITREIILNHARVLGFTVDESSTLTSDDLIGRDKEAFLTGTAVGVVPVIAVDSRRIGDGVPGQITRKLRQLLSQDMADPDKGLAVAASQEQILCYLNSHSSTYQGNRSVTEQLIARLFETVDASRWENLKQFFCEEIIYERPGYAPVVGQERLEIFYSEERVIASGKHHLEGVIVNDNKGACWGRFVGRHKNGSFLDEQFADCYTFKDGKIQTRKSFFFRPAV